jgi:hypothetical protein
MANASSAVIIVRPPSTFVPERLLRKLSRSAEASFSLKATGTSSSKRPAGEAPTLTPTRRASSRLATMTKSR